MTHAATKPNPTVWCDGYGRWHASVPTTASTRDDRAKAHTLIIEELAEREQKTGETLDQARRRMRRQRPATGLKFERANLHGTTVFGE